MAKADFGSISSGTMRPEDLIPEFAGMLLTLTNQDGTDADKAHVALIEEANAIDFEDNELSMDAQDGILEELFEALNAYAPAYGYFGSHPGDGADYGFWLSDEFPQDFDGLRVDDTSEVPADYSGEVLHVNDHGNMTLYSADKGELTEVWSLV